MWPKILGFALVLSTPAALAYGPCDDDAKKLCSSQDFHGETEKNCLHFQIDAVQNAMCSEFLHQEEAEWRKTVESFHQVQSACKDELSKQCPDLAAKDRQLKAQQTCLMSEREKLGASCKEDINRHIRSFQPTIREL